MDWVLLIPFLPFIAFLVMLPMPRTLRNHLVLLPVVAMAGSIALAAFAAGEMFPGGHIGETIWDVAWTLGTVGGAPLVLSLGLDSLAAAMMVMVTVISFAVMVFSLSYMAHDDRRGWFFSVVSLFASAMLFLLLATDLLVLFVMWEIMGVCSYLLIGFWYREPGPRAASQKAFLYTRTGDLGFFIAMGAIFATIGTFNLHEIISSAPDWTPAVLLAVSLGLIWAAIGKSAQFPLAVWLPDAMAGPTPASALIHAATMVAAGVFMLARMLPVLELSPIALGVMGWVGALTALVSGLLAASQTDLKKILAYSTISQLGFMFLALGAAAEVAALWHLTTHAFFKSLLFLGAGIIIHATHTQDIRKMGGLARQMPMTTLVFSIGSFALAGLIPLSGFFSKDEVFYYVLKYSGMPLFIIAALVGLTTAFYVTKTWLTVFFGKPHVAAHEGSFLELFPVSLLAFVTTTLGFLTPTFGDYLGHEGVWPTVQMALISTGITLSGIGLGYLAWQGRFAHLAIGQKLGWLQYALDSGMYLDKVLDYLFRDRFSKAAHGVVKSEDASMATVKGGFDQMTSVFWRFDDSVIDGLVNWTVQAYRKGSASGWGFDTNIVDGLVNKMGELSARLGSRFRTLQTGSLTNYQRMIAGAVVLLLIYVMLELFAVLPKGF